MLIFNLTNHVNKLYKWFNNPLTDKMDYALIFKLYKWFNNPLTDKMDYALIFKLYKWFNNPLKR